MMGELEDFLEKNPDIFNNYISDAAHLISLQSSGRKLLISAIAFSLFSLFFLFIEFKKTSLVFIILAFIIYRESYLIKKNVIKIIWNVYEERWQLKEKVITLLELIEDKDSELNDKLQLEEL